MSFNPKDHMTDLRGRDYLEVKWRLVWFRDVHPSGTIETQVMNTDPLIVRATVSVNGMTLATGHGSADSDGKRVVWTGREIEKAETAAIGRALAHAGFGTQFTGEDEGSNLADSPVEKPASAKKNGKPQADTATPASWKPDAIKWMVNDGYANNAHNANAIWKLLDLDGCGGKADAVARVKLYREWRDTTDAAPEVAAEHAKAGNEPS